MDEMLDIIISLILQRTLNLSDVICPSNIEELWLNLTP